MIGIVAHHQKPAAAPLTRELVASLKSVGLQSLVEEQTAKVAGLGQGVALTKMSAAVELLIVLGGDGTILRVMHKLGGEVPPIFGINIGSLGFLTCLGPTETNLAVESIAARNFKISQRSLLSLLDADRNLLALGLNDVVVGTGARSRLVKLHVSIDGEPLTDFNADGLLVATPTGSTAYSLSAGGPILMPEAPVLVVTPICPHVLTNRSVVLSDASEIRIEPAENMPPTSVTVDGRDLPPLGTGQSLIIRRAEKVLPLVMLPGRSFSEVLRQKLKWSGSNI